MYTVAEGERMIAKIKKAVIPVAVFGTRMLPATKLIYVMQDMKRWALRLLNRLQFNIYYAIKQLSRDCRLC